MPTFLNISEDGRSIDQCLRRRELEAIGIAEGLNLPKDSPAETTRQVLRSYGVNFSKYIDETGNFLWPKTVQELLDVDSMKMPDLRKYCAKAGIKWSLHDKKTVLQDKIREHLKNG